MPPRMLSAVVLPGTRGAQDNGELTAFNGKARAVERVNAGIALAVRLDDVFEFDISHRLIPIWSDNSLVLPISHRPKRDRFILAVLEADGEDDLMIVAGYGSGAAMGFGDGAHDG